MFHTEAFWKTPGRTAGNAGMQSAGGGCWDLLNCIVVYFSSPETCPDGTGGPPGHRHAVHIGLGGDASGRPEGLLQTFLCKDQGVSSGGLSFSGCVCEK